MHHKNKKTEPQTRRAITPSSILSEKLAELKRRILEKASEAEVIALLAQCQILVDPLEDYLTHHTSKPSEALNHLEFETNKLDWQAAYDNSKTDLKLEKEMLSGKVEGQFLKILIASTKSKNVLEIGSFTGYASLAMAEALPEDGQLIACEYDKFAANIAKKQLSKSTHGKKVDIKIGDASITLNQLHQEHKTFDFIFIDADKPNYLNYYKSIMDLGLLAKDGLICVDNTLYQGQVFSTFEISKNGKAIREFNKFVAQDDRVQNVLVPIRDGVTIIRRIDYIEEYT